MNVRKFIAPNARDALKKVKETLGNDAIILSNRGVPGGVEIMAVAARDMAMIVPTVSSDHSGRFSSNTSTAESSESGDDYRVSLSRARSNMGGGQSEQNSPQEVNRPRVQVNIASPNRERGDEIALVNVGIPKSEAMRKTGLLDSQPSPLGRNEHASPERLAKRPVSANHSRGAADVIPFEVMEEIRSLRKIVEQHLAGFAWGETVRTQPVKTEILRQMLDSGFSPQFSRELLSELPMELGVSEAMAWVKGAADRSLRTIGVEDDIVDRGGVFALVGPTGVGKTTTTAKLAARCVLRHGPSKVALITTDGYRIGAHEQLRIYGRILGVSVHLVKDAVELRQTLAELRNKHMVLIDTMGMSQKDKLVPELTDMLAGCSVERLLLLSSTSRGDTLDEVVGAYSGVGLSGCILTKIDEAASLAAALDVIMRHGLRLTYVSNGQRVPEDLHLPNRGYLLHRVFKDLPESSPYRLEGIEPGLMLATKGLVANGGGRG